MHYKEFNKYFSKGDKVRLFRLPEDDEFGWESYIPSEGLVGKTGVVVLNDDYYGLLVKTDDNQYYLPGFVLEKVWEGNPFKVGDLVNYKHCFGNNRTCEVVSINDDFVQTNTGGSHFSRYTLVKPAKPGWNIGCKRFQWDGGEFVSNDIRVSQGLIKEIVEYPDTTYCIEIGGNKPLYNLVCGHFEGLGIKNKCDSPLTYIWINNGIMVSSYVATRKTGFCYEVTILDALNMTSINDWKIDGISIFWEGDNLCFGKAFAFSKRTVNEIWEARNG